MYSIPLAQIAKDLGYAYEGPSDLIPQDVAIDSRQCQEGSLFIALAGARQNGHQFLDQALAAGASALVVSEEAAFHPRRGIGVLYAPQGGERFLQDLARWMRARFEGPVVAITGSQGKTSTKDLLAQILGGRYELVATQENFNNELGLPLTMTRLQEGTQILLLEMGMDRAGDIDFLAALAQPSQGIVTGIGLAHAEHFGSQDGIALAKAELFSHLSASGKVYLRSKDRHFLAGPAEAAGVEAVWCCREDDCDQAGGDCVAKEVDLSVDGSEFTCVYGTGPSFKVRIPFAGSHYIDNALLAIACARDLGLSIDQLQDILPHVRGKSRHRMAYHLLANGCLLINDSYNANPDSMRATIDVLVGYKPRPILACLGDMKELGPYEVEAHREIGAYAVAKGVDRLIAYGPLSHHMADGAKEAGAVEDEVLATEEADACVEDIIAHAGPDTVVLVKGSRAMAMDQIVDGVRDRDVRREDR